MNRQRNGQKKKYKSKLVFGGWTYAVLCCLLFQIYGCQPQNSKVMFESIKANKIIFEESLPTLSDATSGGIEENSVSI